MRSSAMVGGGADWGPRCGAEAAGGGAPFGTMSPPRSSRSLRATSAPPPLPRELPLDKAQQLRYLACRLAVRRGFASGKSRDGGDRMIGPVVHDGRRHAAVLGQDAQCLGREPGPRLRLGNDERERTASGLNQFQRGANGPKVVGAR